MNRLSGETSPYLLQHAGNPVDWYPWGDEALAEASRSDRPLFVSVGYSACHWCHVMAHESFEDDETAAYLNEHFVSIKVDREERPDLDAVYMEAVQAMSGQGGWPMTVFCTADGRPFFGGTYFPSHPTRGRPTFRELLEAIWSAWTERRDDLLGQADALSEAVRRRIGAPAPGAGGRPRTTTGAGGAGGAAPPDSDTVDRAVERAVARLAELHDPEFGGFGDAPKFPQAPLLELLLRAHVAGVDGRGGPAPLEIVRTALAAMARGGIYDHVGGGFARYSVDRWWLVPHFEKMLYDQAALARVYLHGWQLTGEPEWRQVLDETIGYVLRELVEEPGGAHAAEDADSEGEEGRYYLWTPAQLETVLGGEAAAEAAAWYGVTPGGNFEGRTILSRPAGSALQRPASVEDSRAALQAARDKRVHPGRDDKVLTEWNAMWWSTVAEAAAATGDTAWRDAAVGGANFLLAALRRDDGRWLRSWKAGKVVHLAYAGDYAWLVDCFTRLAELTGEQRWLAEASTTADALVDLFADPAGGLFTTGRDAPELVVRPRELMDGVIPAASSVGAAALCRLGALTGDAGRTDAAAAIVAAAGDFLERAPTAVPHLLGAAELLACGTVEVVVTGDRPDLVAAARRRYLPAGVLAWGERAGPLFEDRPDGFAYVCRGGSCRLPVSEPAALLDELGSAAASRGSR